MPMGSNYDLVRSDLECKARNQDGPDPPTLGMDVKEQEHTEAEFTRFRFVTTANCRRSSSKEKTRSKKS